MTTISGSTRFSVTVFDRPDIIGTGYLELRHNQLTDFEFSVLGYTFTEADMAKQCQCAVIDGFGVAGVHLDGAFGLLTWHFPDGNFGVQFRAGEDWFGGTSEDGQVTGALSDYHLFAVPAGGSLSLIVIGLAALIASRILSSRCSRAVRATRS